MQFIIAFTGLFSLFFFHGCVSVKAYEKERLADAIMVFDFDAGSATLKADILTTREGSFGGLSGANAGGCSCK